MSMVQYSVTGTNYCTSANYCTGTNYCKVLI